MKDAFLLGILLGLILLTNVAIFCGIVVLISVHHNERT